MSNPRVVTRARRFVFTKNNYTEDDLAYLIALFERPEENKEVSYLLFGKEIAPTTGTRHLQGYIEFNTRKTFVACRQILTRCHVEVAKGNPQQCATYAKKDGDFTEFGSITRQGKRSDVESFLEWIKAFDGYPSDVEIAEAFPSLFFHSYKACVRWREMFCSAVILETPDRLRDWQAQLEEILRAPPDDDRKILFYVDENGGTGKSFFVRYYLSKYDDGQMFGIAKRDDLAHAVDVTKKVFLINVPRTSMEYLSYSFLEQLKDRLLFSPKYDSRMKKMLYKTHVVVFCNEYPDMTKLSGDRYEVITDFE